MGEWYLFLWGVDFGPRGVDFVPRAVVLGSLGVNFLPLKVDFWLQGLDFSLPKYVLSLWKWILIFRSRFGHIWVDSGLWERNSKKCFWYYTFCEKIDFCRLEKILDSTGAFWEKIDFMGGGGGVIKTGREKMQNYDIYKTWITLK